SRFYVIQVEQRAAPVESQLVTILAECARVLEGRERRLRLLHLRQHGPQVVMGDPILGIQGDGLAIGRLALGQTLQVAERQAEKYPRLCIALVGYQQVTD